MGAFLPTQSGISNHIMMSTDLTSNDVHENLIDKINSKYFTSDDFINIKFEKI